MDGRDNHCIADAGIKTLQVFSQLRKPLASWQGLVGKGRRLRDAASRSRPTSFEKVVPPSDGAADDEADDGADDEGNRQGKGDGAADDFHHAE
jgi:hypothetical protein